MKVGEYRDEGKMLIYALRDPRTNEIKYVGATGDRLQDRVYCHMASKSKYGKLPAWITELKAQGLRVKAHGLEVVDFKRWPDAERLWIWFCDPHGNSLLNVKAGGGGAKRHRATPEEVRAIYMHEI